MNKIFLIPLLIIYGSASSQDRIKTDNGDIAVTPILHGSLVLGWNDLNIYVDPYGGADSFDGIRDPDLILITDIHGDHLNQETLNEIKIESADFLVPQAVYDKLSEPMQNKSVVIDNYEVEEWKEIVIRAIPMYNLPEDEDSRHPRGRGNGYILTIDGKHIYISGDTEDIEEMRKLNDIEIAFICMNQPYTMSVEQAADAVNEFKPKIVYPYHYRGKDGLSDVEKFKELVNEGIEVRLRDWYPK